MTTTDRAGRKTKGKDNVIAFVAERGSVTVGELCDRFNVQTVKAALRDPRLVRSVEGTVGMAT